MKVHLSRNADASCIEGYLQGRWRPVLRWTRGAWPKGQAKYTEMRDRIALNSTGRHDSGLENEIEFIFD